MTDAWIHCKRKQAGVDPDKHDPEPLLEEIEPWQARAQQVAEEASRHELKTAVKKVPPSVVEAKTLFQLYALWAGPIYGICVHTYQTHVQNAAADEPVAGLEDLLQESYILFQRAMVRSTTKEKMRSRLRARMAEHVRTQMTIEDDPDDRRRQPDRSAIAPGFDLKEIYQELVDEGKVSRRAAQLWQRLTK
ncbi:hypothetical protein [Salinibacter ruber]|uniref:hypothetical protein n=1 Tax=Salinibacter ruber TaxID=146919 RepID=UPI002074025B|nr:hypothetical protein [Salinibacter ruber]